MFFFSGLVFTLCFITHLCSIPEAPLRDGAQDPPSWQVPQGSSLSADGMQEYGSIEKVKHSDAETELITQGRANKKVPEQVKMKRLFFFFSKWGKMFFTFFVKNCFVCWSDVKSFVKSI